MSNFFVTSWTVARQAPLPMEFSRQEYWSGLSFPSPGIFPTQELNQGLLHCGSFLYHWATRESLDSHLLWVTLDQSQWPLKAVNSIFSEGSSPALKTVILIIGIKKTKLPWAGDLNFKALRCLLSLRSRGHQAKPSDFRTPPHISPISFSHPS